MLESPSFASAGALMDRVPVCACASTAANPRNSGRQSRAGSRPRRRLRAAGREPAAARAGEGSKLSEEEAGRGVAERPLGEREGSGREANRPRWRRHEDAGRAARLGSARLGSARQDYTIGTLPECQAKSAVCGSPRRAREHGSITVLVRHGYAPSRHSASFGPTTPWQNTTLPTSKYHTARRQRSPTKARLAPTRCPARIRSRMAPGLGRPPRSKADQCRRQPGTPRNRVAFAWPPASDRQSSRFPSKTDDMSTSGGAADPGRRERLACVAEPDSKVATFSSGGNLDNINPAPAAGLPCVVRCKTRTPAACASGRHGHTHWVYEDGAVDATPSASTSPNTRRTPTRALRRSRPS